MPSDFPKDFQIKKLDLINAQGDILDVHFLLVEFSTFESINNVTVAGMLTLNDATNQLANFPIFGFDRVHITFATPDLEPFDMEFRIYKIADRKIVKERQQIYTLHLVAKEQIDDFKKRVSKSYKGVLISDIVTDIHTNFLGGGTLTIEPTKFTHHVVIPNLHPIQAIQWLATRANSTAWNGSNYLYYQDKNGFNFVTGEKLVSQPSVDRYVFQPANVRDQEVETGYKPRDLNKDEKAMIDWHFKNHSDVLSNLAQGMYGNELLTHNHTTKKWSRYAFDYVDSFDQHQHLDTNKLFSDAWPDGRTAQTARLKFHSEGQEPYPFRPDQWLPARTSQLQQLHNIMVEIGVPGHSMRTVGQVIELVLPSPEPPVEGQQIYDKFYRGKYLIAELRHKIDQNTFTTSMVLVKDSVFTAYS